MIIFQNKDIIAVDKPGGLPVQGGKNIKKCLLSILEKELNTKIYLIHRLDKETSGIMLAAKSSSAAAKYSALMQKDKINKVYLTVCAGKFVKKKGSFNEPITSGKELKTARTDYRVLQTMGKYSLLELSLKTGRTHQIRIHLSQKGHPILGDDKYGDFKLNKEIKNKYKITKMLLFSKSIFINNHNKIKVLNAKTPEHFIEFFNIFNLKMLSS